MEFIISMLQLLAGIALFIFTCSIVVTVLFDAIIGLIEWIDTIRKARNES